MAIEKKIKKSKSSKGNKETETQIETSVETQVEVQEVPVEVPAPVEKKSKKEQSESSEESGAIVGANSDETPASYSFYAEEIHKKRRQIREIENEISKLFNQMNLIHRREVKPRRTKSTVKRVQTKKPIIDSLAELMGVEKGARYDRGEVQKFLCSYIKEHNLQSEDDKKCFEADSYLERVLGKP